MEIRVVSGSGTGPTELAARDAALLDAGVGNYNLIRLSSVIPRDASIDVGHRVQSVGPEGGLLPVVEAAASAVRGERAVAALGWARGSDGLGLLYEESASGTEELPDGGRTRFEGGSAVTESTLEDRVRSGIAAGFSSRGWDAPEPEVISRSVRATSGPAAVTILAVFGEARPADGRLSPE